jgi:ABC-type branched-subunit amino acid transport system ATPase component
MPLLSVRGVERSFYGVNALSGVDLDVQAGRITGLIGPNGAGKTTLFNCITGIIPPDRGSIRFDGRDITGLRPDRITHAGLVRTFQIARGLPRLSVLENLLVYGADQPGERLGVALAGSATARRRETELVARAAGIARRLNLMGVIRSPASDLSGGQKKLLEIGRALMTEPKLILLDEPVAGVNPTPDPGARNQRAPEEPYPRGHHHPPYRASYGYGGSALRSRRGDGGGASPGRGHVRANGGGCQCAGGVHGTPPRWGSLMGTLTARGIVAGYSAADEVLKGVDFQVREGEIVCVIGPNGAGKSTLLKAIAGLIKPSRGSVDLQGKDITGLAARDVSRLGLAYVPQEHNVFPTMSVRENLEMGGYVDRRAAEQRIEAAFERFPVLSNKRRHAARTLSGGERQMLAMAMALMVEPVVLLLDEPSAGLSPLAAATLFDNIIAIHRSGVSIALVEQNANEALAISDRAYILVDGRNARTGDAKTLAADPEIRRIFLGG